MRDRIANFMALCRRHVIDAPRGNKPEHARNSIVAGDHVRVYRGNSLVVDLTWVLLPGENYGELFDTAVPGPYVARAPDGVVYEDGSPIIGIGHTKDEAVLDGHFRLLTELARQASSLKADAQGRSGSI
jgi:hypothetical protein